MAAEGQPVFHDFLGVARRVRVPQSRKLAQIKPSASDITAGNCVEEEGHKSGNHLEASPAINSGSGGVGRELADFNQSESIKRELMKKDARDHLRGDYSTSFQLRRALDVDLQGSLPFSKMVSHTGKDAQCELSLNCEQRNCTFVETTNRVYMSEVQLRPRGSDASRVDDRTMRCARTNINNNNSSNSPGCMTSINSNMMMMQRTTNNATETMRTARVLLCPSDEGSRTGLLNSPWTASAAGPRARDRYYLLRDQGNHTFDRLLPPFQAPSSSSPLEMFPTSTSLPQTGAVSNSIHGTTQTIARQLTIFYGGQAHVFEDVPSDKLEAIMALAAGSSGRSWSTTYHSQIKPNEIGSLAAKGKKGT